MRRPYSITNASQNEFDLLPRLPLILMKDDRQIEYLGLVDSGATVNVLPYEVDLELGATWDDRKAIIPPAGNLGRQLTMPFSTIAQISDFPPIELLFAWVNRPNTPLILGQTDFFLEFDVCFYRSKQEFEVKPKVN